MVITCKLPVLREYEAELQVIELIGCKKARSRLSYHGPWVSGLVLTERNREIDRAPTGDAYHPMLTKLMLTIHHKVRITRNGAAIAAKDLDQAQSCQRLVRLCSSIATHKPRLAFESGKRLSKSVCAHAKQQSLVLTTQPCGERAMRVLYLAFESMMVV